jgi:two-component SAPR family response regulator
MGVSHARTPSKPVPALRGSCRPGYEAAGKFEEAVLLDLKGIEADHLAEELYQNLMRCYMKLGRRAEAMAFTGVCGRRFL